MHMVKRINFEVTYKGKTYKRVADFAKDVGLDTHVVLSRYKEYGWDTPEKLAQPLVKGRTHPAYKIEYKGVEYSSLAEFTRAFKLSYPQVLKHWRSGIKEPAELINKSKPKSREKTTKDLLDQKKIDQTARNKYLKSLNLLSPMDLSEAIGVPSKTIVGDIYNFFRPDRYKAKNGITNLGIHKDDIVMLTDNETTLKTISNTTAVPKYGIKPIAINHVEARRDYIKSLNLVKMPYFKNYYYDPKGKRMWTARKYFMLELNPDKGQNKFTLRQDKHSYSFSYSNIADWLKYPNIKYEDLISYDDLKNILGIDRHWWSNNGIRQTIMPDIHKRYSFETHKAKIGFDKKELIEAFKTSQKTIGFVSKLEKQPTKGMQNE